MNQNTTVFYGKTTHNFHLVNPSPWPFITSLAAFSVAFCGVAFMRNYAYGFFCFFNSLIFLILCMGGWWRDVIRESTFEGHHTTRVQKGLKMAFCLFIASEVMFFFAFFWGYFHAGMSPTHDLGCVWPPKGIPLFDSKLIPFLNTIILLSSGATITWAHHALLASNKLQCKLAMIFTIFLAIIFTACQVFEYIEAEFTISDSVFGSCFFMTTGFHGFHVFLGTCILTVNLIRLIKNHYTSQHHIGFESGAWYWHFVDIVWLWLFIFFYIWGV
jgi:heme/copper-type cytochrome/quinol oxidase subunit 3